MAKIVMQSPTTLCHELLIVFNVWAAYGQTGAEDHVKAYDQPLNYCVCLIFVFHNSVKVHICMKI